MFPASFTALYDANVLYPAPLRDFLLVLASRDIFKARWSEQIHNEWMRNVLKNNKHLDPKRIQRTREFMDQAVDDCLVHNYEDLIDSLVLPDPDDRHVLAAAITGRADVIVTFNLKDFPETALTPYGIEAQHPDEFLSHLIDLHPDQVCLAAKAMRNRLRKPPQSVEDYLMSLAKQKLPQAVAFLSDRREFI